MYRQILIAAALLAGSSAALAHERGHGGGFERADTNSDGSVTREEFLAAHDQRFARMDKNSDGAIDSQDIQSKATTDGGEERKHRRHRGHGLQAMLDADNDGKITKQEFAAKAGPLFDQADKDGNGVLSSQELDTIKAQRREAARKMRDRAQQSTQQ